MTPLDQIGYCPVCLRNSTREEVGTGFYRGHACICPKCHKGHLDWLEEPPELSREALLGPKVFGSVYKPDSLDPAVFPPVCLLDMDGTCFVKGTDEWLPGAVERIQKIAAQGHRIVAFTSRPAGPWYHKFLEINVPLFAHIQKPLAIWFYIVDDCLVPRLCAESLEDLFKQDAQP
jgi:hypothetical protein